METVSDADNSTLTVTTEHFSKYLIVDCSKWYEAWSENNYPMNGNTLHTAITIDCSDSMNWNDPEDENGDCYRKTAANGFVDTMREEDQASVILFHEDSVLKQSLTDDKDLLKTAISQMFENGYTNYDSALRTAIDSLEVDNNSDSENIIIFLSDGVPTDNTGTEVDEIDTSLVDEARLNNIRIYTIGLTSNAREDILTYMAEETGGEYYYADTAQELVEYFLTINMEEKYDVTTDTDGDGLPDLFETYGMPIANGQVIFSDPENTDSDGDGLLDGEEVIMHIVDDEEEIKAAYNYMYDYIPDIFINDNGGIYFTMVADPENEDTDGDGIVDGDEVDSPELEPYNNLDPLHRDTLSSLFGNLDNYKQNNIKTNAVYLELNENEITIMPRIYLLDEYQTKAFDISDEAQRTYLKANSQASLDILARLDAQNLDYTLGNIFIDAIVDRWTTNFIGTSFDFLPGLDVTTKVIPEVIYEKPADKKTRYIEVEIKKTFGDTSVTTGGTDTTINKTIIMESLGDEISIYEGICAHEFGHTLLIGDAYPTAYDNHNFTSVFNETSDHELYCVVDNSKYGRKDVGGGEIMLYNSDVLPNDIEMFLFGYTYNEKQYFVSEFSNRASAAIREYPNTYYYYSPHSYEFNDIYKENYSYSWYDDKGFIPTEVSIKNTEYDGVGYLYYEELDGDTITISILGLLDNSYAGSVIIPATVDGYTVTRISDGAFRNSNISGISFDNPNSIKTIGRYAFYNCKKLLSIDIPDNVEIIGSNTFENCTVMQQVELPKNLIVIDKSAFNACSNLSTVKLNEKILEIGNYAFYNCRNLTEISFGENLQKIGKYALSATNIKSISLPQNIVEIGENAFRICNNLESVTFYALEFNENRYNNTLFQQCLSLRVVYVPSVSYKKYCDWLSTYKQVSIVVVN